MDLTKIPLMNAITRKMGWLGRKQRVIAQNIANADTPNYRAKTIKAESFKGLLDKAPRQARGQAAGGGRQKTRMVVTDDRHFSGPGGVARGSSTEIKDPTPHEASPDGNNVILEEQMIQMAETQMEYGMLVNLYRKQVGILKTSLGRSQR